MSAWDIDNVSAVAERARQVPAYRRGRRKSLRGQSLGYDLKVGLPYCGAID